MKRVLCVCVAAWMCGLQHGALAIQGPFAPIVPSQIRIVPGPPGPGAPTPGLPPGAPPTPARPALPVPLKVVTYNLATGNKWKSTPLKFDALADFILAQNPDVVLLQEVHDRYIDGRSPNVDQPRFWRERLRMSGRYLVTARAWNLWGHPLGTAGEMILSKWPIVRWDEDRQPFDRGVTLAFGIGATQSPRSKLSVVIDVRGTRVRLASVHLPGSTVRPLFDYVQWLETFPEPAVIGGDFNRDWRDLDGDDWHLRSIAGRYDVVPNAKTDEVENDGIEDECGRIDWILVPRGRLTFTGPGGWARIDNDCRSHNELLPNVLSDHPMVHATVVPEGADVTNAGFERGLTGWSVWSGDPAYRASTFRAGQRGNDAAVQYGASGVIFRDLTVTAGRDYDVSAWVWCPFGSAQGQLSLHDTAEGNYHATPYGCMASEWTELRLRYRANQTNKVRVHLARSNGAGVVLWDSVRVASVP